MRETELPDDAGDLQSDVDESENHSLKPLKKQACHTPLQSVRHERVQLESDVDELEEDILPPFNI